MLTHGAICCRCYAAGFPVVSPNRSIESRYFFAKAQLQNLRIGLPPKIRSLELVHGLCVLVNLLLLELVADVETDSAI